MVLGNSQAWPKNELIRAFLSSTAASLYVMVISSLFGINDSRTIANFEFMSSTIRLIYLKVALRFLAGAETLSGQTASENGGRSK